jgi:hypothetical protein
MVLTMYERMLLFARVVGIGELLHNAEQEELTVNESRLDNWVLAQHGI